MAVFTEQELMNTSVDIGDILDKALYLESGSTMITPKTVAVTESSAVQAMVVRFGDIEALSEEYGYDYIDAMVAVAEANEIDPKYLAVAVDEADIIENPDLIGELDHVVINPQSENSFAYQFCESMIDAWVESDGQEDAFLEAVVDDEVALDILSALDEAKGNNAGGGNGLLDKAKELGAKAQGAASNVFNTVKDKASQGATYAKNNKVKTGLGVAAAAALGYGAKKAYDKIKGSKVPSPQEVLKQATGKDKNWIGRKIASLRSMYQKWLAKANAEKDAGRASAFKKVATVIMNCIDALMKKLQGSVGAIGTGK